MTVPDLRTTAAFNGRCWVMPVSDVEQAVDQINHAMNRTVVGKADGTLFLIDSGLLLMDRQIVVILTHGGTATLYVCDSLEVNQ